MKKVLVITYYWPPAGGPGVQRWLKFAKYLPEYGVEPIMYVPKNATYPILDESLKSEVPKDIQIIKRKIKEPYSVAKFFSGNKTKTISSGIIKESNSQSNLEKVLLYIRGNLFIPDARVFWVNPSVKFLQKYISENNIKTIITSGPPHSMHLIGLKLRQQNRIKWIADFRDPWTQIGYHEKLKLNDRSQEKHQEMESLVLTTADAVVTTSFTTKQEFEKKTYKPITVITNGYDEYKSNVVKENSKFSLAHIGSLLSGRNPINLWEVLDELISENKEFASNFQLKLIGTVSPEILEALEKFDLRKNLQLEGYVSHNRAMEIQRESSVLLLIEINNANTKGIIPGKFFEYLSAQKPILALGPEGWDIKKLLVETKAGTYFTYEDKNRLKSHIIELFTQYQNGQLQTSTVDIEKYSRRNLAKEMAKLVKSL